jgi:hypothetical protein
MHHFSAHGKAVLHLSKRKSPHLEEEKRRSQKSHPGPDSIYHEFENYRIIIKKVKMADNLGPNGLVVSARKCAGPIPAKNCTSCRK